MNNATAKVFSLSMTPGIWMRRWINVYSTQQLAPSLMLRGSWVSPLPGDAIDLAELPVSHPPPTVHDLPVNKWK